MSKREDLTNKKFGKLTVLAPAPSKCSHNTKWFCQCECGTLTIVNTSNLKGGFTKSCGCIRHTKMVDLSNKKFGRLTVLEPTKQRYYGYVVWLCKCDCGKFVGAPMHNLLNGNIISCGCAEKEIKANWGNTVKQLRKEKSWNRNQPKKRHHQYKRVEGIDI